MNRSLDSRLSMSADGIHILCLFSGLGEPVGKEFLLKRLRPTAQNNHVTAGQFELNPIPFGANQIAVLCYRIRCDISSSGP